MMFFKNIGLDFSNPNCKVIPADLTDKESLKGLFKYQVTHIFHTGSLYNYSAPMDLLKKVNIDGAINLFEWAIKKKGLKQHYFHPWGGNNLKFTPLEKALHFRAGIKKEVTTW